MATDKDTNVPNKTSDYISREAALEIVRKAYFDESPCPFEMTVRDILQEIVYIPPADVRPVVLCRDCYAYRKDKELARAAYLNPNEYCALLKTEMPEDGFCYYGMIAANCGADMRGDNNE